MSLKSFRRYLKPILRPRALLGVTLQSPTSVQNVNDNACRSVAVCCWLLCARSYGGVLAYCVPGPGVDLCLVQKEE